ncbi:unnamed protein product [Coregonus sp. 'balchen']|nr:unnamed protein product [Coregonus sp. 'balchen']
MSPGPWLVAWCQPVRKMKLQSIRLPQALPLQHMFTVGWSCRTRLPSDEFRAGFSDSSGISGQAGPEQTLTAGHLGTAQLGPGWIYMCTLPVLQVLDTPPTDQELKNVIDKLAQFVARNGPEFEKMTMEKTEGQF